MIRHFCDICGAPALENKHRRAGFLATLPDGTEFTIWVRAKTGPPNVAMQNDRDVDLCLSCLVKTLGEYTRGPLLRDDPPVVVGYVAGHKPEECPRCAAGDYNHTH
jgi:hypothetical protein